MHGQHNIKICVCVCVCVCCWCICSVACVCVRMIAIVLSYRQTTLPSRFWALSRLVAKKLCPLCVPALLPLNGFPRNLALGDFFLRESIDKLQIPSKSNEIIGHIAWRHQTSLVLEIRMKYFAALQRCQGNPFFFFFCISMATPRIVYRWQLCKSTTIKRERILAFLR